MIKKYVLDTHALFWYLTASPRLSRKSKEVIDKALAGGVSIIISVISLCELYYLNEKVGTPIVFLDEFKKIGEIFEIVPVDPGDILFFTELSDISEMHDRIIASLAMKHNAIVITKDKEIIASKKVRVFW